MQEKISIEEFVVKKAVELIKFKDYDYEMNKKSPSWHLLLTEQEWEDVYNIFRASKTASEPFSTPS